MAKTPSPAYEFVVAVLNTNPAATFQEVKRLGAVQGFTIYPVVYGRAKAVLGLVPSAGQSAAGPNDAAASGSVTSRSAEFESFVEQIREIQRQRDEAVEMLERIRVLLEGIIEESEQD